MTPSPAPGLEPEPFLPFKEISTVLKVPEFAIRRAAKRGEFAVYRCGTGRARARLSEVVLAFERSRCGGSS